MSHCARLRNVLRDGAGLRTNPRLWVSSKQSDARVFGSPSTSTQKRSVGLSRSSILLAIIFSFSTTSFLAGDIVEFFSPQLVATPAGSGPTWDSIHSQGYKFTYTRDKYFTGGGSVPTGRSVRVQWPTGIEAQAVTAGPTPGKAKITIERLDGSVFDFLSFSAKLLANTAGAGGSFEVVPFLNGEEVFKDPIVFDASGYYGQVFSYDGSPNPWGTTALLRDFDKYSIDLYVDFALVALQFEGPAAVPEPGTLAIQCGGLILASTLFFRRRAIARIA